MSVKISEALLATLHVPTWTGHPMLWVFKQKGAICQGCLGPGQGRRAQARGAQRPFHF